MRVDQIQKQNGKTVIRWKRYGEERFKTERFSPYFYVDADEGYRLPGGIDGKVRRDVEPKAYDGTELHQVVLRSTRDASDARKAADNHFEADIPFERRYYIDRVEPGLFGDGDVTDNRPHIMHLDIEVGAETGKPDPASAMAPVLTVSCYSEKFGTHRDLLLKPDGWEPDAEVNTDDKGREYLDPDWDGAGGRVYLFDTETAMLGALGSLIRRTNVEVLTGWNFEEFDAAYLLNRAANLPGIDESVFSPLGNAYVSRWTTKDGNENVNVTIGGIDVIDMLEGYKHLRRRDKPPNYRLGTVADHEGLEVSKIPFDTSRVREIWEERPMEVMEYNRRDSVLTYRVDQEMNMFDMFLEVHRQLAVPLSDTLNNSVLVEMFVMSRAPEWGIERRILDSKRDTTNDFEGGNTRQPVPGLYEYVFSVDVTSEYPNWVRAANLSPETVVTREDDEWGRDDLIDTPVDGIKFLPHDERLGILPRAVDEMFDLKRRKTNKRAGFEYGTDSWKQADLERDTTKWLLNSIQGVTGMETHRLSKNEVSAAITAFGRETVEFMVDVGEEFGYDFIYGDTDSVFFHDPTGEDVDGREAAIEAAKELQAEVNERLPEWANGVYGITDERRHKLEVEPDKVAMRAFFPNKKKRYTLWLIWNDGSDIDKISHTGWAIVRSDTSDVEHRAQKKTLEALMHNRSESFVTRKVRDEMQRVVDGEYDPIEMARPQGSGQPFAQYGSSSEVDFDGIPYFAAAMLSSNGLLGTDFEGGDKAYMLPVEETESVTMNGTTNSVNYIALEDEDTELPDWVEIDYAKVLDNIIGKLERIYRSLDWDLGALREHKSDCLGEVEVRRIQEDNHTLEAFSS